MRGMKSVRGAYALAAVTVAAAGAAAAGYVPAQQKQTEIVVYKSPT
ncbi:MAG TPA: hypothetical protein VD793_08925 [Gemmatimonadales bacterium]|nr:hypothetical protein [Gemmatimonadales bacterium]